MLQIPLDFSVRWDQLLCVPLSEQGVPNPHLLQIDGKLVEGTSIIMVDKMQKSHNKDFFKKPFAAVALETGVLSTESHYEIAIRGFKCNLCRT